MNPSRLQQLEEFYREDPGDPFNVYALATEYLASEPQRSLELFNVLLRDHPDYVPTYYHTGKLLEQFDDPASAQEVYERGITVARAANDQKAARELKAALDELLS
jgi:hypothetical protein